MHGSGVVPEVVGAVVVLLVVAAVVRAAVKRVPLPFTVVLVVIGIALAAAEPLLPAFLHPVVVFELSGDLILFVFVPTLVFESAANLDLRQLRRNLAPVLLLAVPGLLLSTTLIGVALAWLTPLPLDVSLLLGAILSATDPVAVVSLFGQLGAPTRLTVLVEGESLMNDATAIVVSRIVLGVVASGVADAGTVVRGTADFVIVFLGGLLAGALLALLVGWLIGRIESDALLEVPLTVTLAYASFLVAEEWLGVSGVMATLAAGLVLGGWGRTRVSPDVAHLLHEVWGQLAFGANALIFLLVGLRVDLGVLAGDLSTLAWVVGAMLVARAAVVFGLVPLGSRLPGAAPVAGSHQVVMWWGGLRGAISLALVLSLPEGLTDQADLVGLVLGAVLFTLLVEGLTIEPLVVRLGLADPPLEYRWAHAEVGLESARAARQALDDLRDEGVFTARVGRRAQSQLDAEIVALQADRERLREAEFDDESARRVVWISLLALERAGNWELFERSEITAATARRVDLDLELQLEHVRERGALPPFTTYTPVRLRAQRFAEVVAAIVPVVRRLLRRLDVVRTAQDYERSWTQHQTSRRALAEIDRLAAGDDVPEGVLAEARGTYVSWHAAAGRRLDATADQFPEFVEAMQERHARRLVLEEQRAVVAAQEHAGLLPGGAAADLRDRLRRRSAQTRGLELTALELDLAALLRSLPFFADLDDAECGVLTRRLRQRTLPAGVVVVQQGDAGDSVFIIARGVVRATHRDKGGRERSTTMMAGDFFGEIALLHGGTRTATCRTATPTALYELSRPTILELASEHATIREALDAADRARNESLAT